MTVRYLNPDRIRQLTRGKLRVSDNETDIEEGAMSTDEFKRLIEEAETEVEVDLNERYEVPFQTMAGAGFDKLPESTRRQLLLLLEHKAVNLVLDYSFGAGSVVDAENYTKNLYRRYVGLVKKLVERNEDGKAGWKRPPLADLKVSYHNQMDNGFLGSVLITGDSNGDFPSSRINDPSVSFFGGGYRTDEEC